MIKQVVDRDEVARYVEAVRDRLDTPQLQDRAVQAADTFEGTGNPVE
ncbi:MAG TPA: hypothetical protein VNU24_02990 [Solirubrobacteraceae bacterium]|jgi:hypothetical protein|nr:hypothetical protein [Solirubrobacteraceae bacterium]